METNMNVELIRDLIKSNEIDIQMDYLGKGSGDIETLIKCVVGHCLNIINSRCMKYDGSEHVVTHNNALGCAYGDISDEFEI